MPLKLPRAYVVPSPTAVGPGLSPVIEQGNPGLADNRLTTYQFELLDHDENFLGLLGGVQVGGNLSWSAAASIKGGGEITVTDLEIVPGEPGIHTPAALAGTNLVPNPNVTAGIAGWGSNDGANYLSGLENANPITAPTSFMTTRVGTVVATNLATNPNLEASATNWASANSALYVFARDTAAPISGAVSAMTTKTAGAAGRYATAVVIGQNPCIEAVPITASIDVKSELSGRRVSLQYQWRTAAGVYLSTSPGGVYQIPDMTGGQVYRGAVTATPPATAALCDVVVNVVTVDGSNSIEGERVWVDNLNVGDSDYFDGSTPASGGYSYRWTGTPNASTSERLGTNNNGLASSCYLAAIPVVSGPVTFGMTVRTEQSDRRVDMTMYWLPGGTYSPRQTVITATTANTPVRGYATFDAPAGTTSCYPTFEVLQGSGPPVAAGERVWWDNATVEQAVTDGAYFDGSTPADGRHTYRWTGAPNASTSERWTRPETTPGVPMHYATTNRPVRDAVAHVDWLNARIRPWIIVTDLETGLREAYPQGVFLPAAPVEDWSDAGRSWRIELLDKSSILDSDIYTSGGRPATYTLPSGSNVVAAVVNLIRSTGEDTPAIPADPTAVLAAAQTWDMGTTLLKIINDLLDTANYFSIWTDEWGQFQLTKYISPMSRPPTYEFESPFSYGELSRLDPTWTFDDDIYAVPNRVVLVGQGSDTAPAWVGTAINNNPTSPFSYQNRGRWITYVETEVEAISQAALQDQAVRKLRDEAMVTGKISVQHVFLPWLRINGLIRFTNERAALDTWCVISNTEVVFDSGGLCSTSLTEVVST